MLSEQEKQRAMKLAELALKGVGGEQSNSAKLLKALLERSGSLLSDIKPGWPENSDPATLIGWRESLTWLAQLEGPARQEAVQQLVDAEDLSQDEMRRLMLATDLESLVQARWRGWRTPSGEVQEREWATAAGSLENSQILQQRGSLVQRIERAAALQIWEQRHPTRRIRTGDRLLSEYAAGLAEGLGGEVVEVSEAEISAKLDASQLARLRATLSNEGGGMLEQGRLQLQQWARQKGRKDAGRA